jgi:hypothetical protein
MSDREEEEETTRNQEINTLIIELQALRVDFEFRSEAISRRLTRLQLNQGLRDIIPEPINTTRQRGNPYSVQDIVRITNNHRGRQGTIGTIVRVTPRRVVVRTASNSDLTRSYRNVELVTQVEEGSQDDDSNRFDRPQ